MIVPSILSGGGLDTSAAHLGEAEVRQIARERYGLSGAFRRFDTEKDDTYRIRTPDGEAFVLKVANPAEKPVEIDFQIDLLRHIEQRAPDVPVPRVLADREGGLRSLYRALDGTDRIVRVISYLEGTPLDSTTSSPVERERVGEILARLRLATADFRHPGEDRVLAWDVQHLMQLAPLLSGIDDAGQRSLLRTALDRFAVATEGLDTLRRQVLHNDFSRSNIVVDHADPAFVKGIIDFGDAVRTAIAVDVSTALLNQLPLTPVEDAFGAGRDLLRGYLAVADLTEEELALIPHLTMGRVIARILLSHCLARIFPQNATYVLRNTPPCWWQLGWFLDRDPEEVGAVFMPQSAASPLPQHG
ncbi:MAG: phosphotransferase [Phreatobacter sp.]|nr:phosphotransferase [Phreatobacter sp.]